MKLTLKNFDKPTSFLHASLAVVVTLQIILAFLMKISGEVGSIFFRCHIIFGICTFVIVLIHWCWSILGNPRGGIRHLFPWTAAGLKAVRADTKNLLAHCQLPAMGPRPGLPGFVHGLGLLVVSGMAISGIFIFVAWLGSVWSVFHDVAHIHVFIAFLVWAYWLGHIVMSVLHHVKKS